MVYIKSTTGIYDYFKFPNNISIDSNLLAMMDIIPGIWEFKTKIFFSRDFHIYEHFGSISYWYSITYPWHLFPFLSPILYVFAVVLH